jgi:hypothetical protein
MKKKIGLTALGVIFLLAPGCATSTDRAAYHQAQVEAITMQMAAISKIKPILHIEAHPGQQIVMSGVKSLEVYYPLTGEAFKQVEQFKDEYVPVYLSALNLMGIPISIATQGYFFNEALKTVQGGNRSNYYYGNNNTGQQGTTFGSGTVIGSPGAGAANANANATAMPTTTTTTELMPAAGGVLDDSKP